MNSTPPKSSWLGYYLEIVHGLCINFIASRPGDLHLLGLHRKECGHFWGLGNNCLLIIYLRAFPLITPESWQISHHAIGQWSHYYSMSMQKSVWAKTATISPGDIIMQQIDALIVWKICGLFSKLVSLYCSQRSTNHFKNMNRNTCYLENGLAHTENCPKSQGSGKCVLDFQ